MRVVPWVLPYLAIWLVTGSYAWWMLGGPHGCDGLCAVVHVWFAYLAVAFGLALSALVGLAQLALLLVSPGSRSRGRTFAQ